MVHLVDQYEPFCATALRTKLFQATPNQLREVQAEASVALRLSRIHPMHPYRMRHTGASVDFALGARRLEEVQRRGRWRQAKSLRRYEHGGRLNELFARLPTCVQQFAQHCSARLDSVLDDLERPAGLPW